MKVAPHLIGLYRKTARRYNKLISKIQRKTVSSYERKTFLQQLKKLFKKLRDLEAQLKIAAAIGTIALMLNSSQALAQQQPSTLGPFMKQTRLHNPLREPIFTSEDPAITAVDFDQDGDVDILMGEYSWYSGGKIRYFENQSKNDEPVYEELLGEDNPFNNIVSLSPGVAPSMADIDKDGDLDLFLGQNGWSNTPGNHSTIEYYRNNGGTFAKQTGAWNQTTKAGNPFNSLVFGYNVRPTFVDLDKDGDIDIVIGSYHRTGRAPYEYHYIDYYQNNGNGVFTRGTLTIDDEPTSYGDSMSPAFADIDKDGDLDMFVGTYYDGYLLYYRQDSPGNFTRQEGVWNPAAKTGNPFHTHRFAASASPAFVDFNGDGHVDLFVADDQTYYDYKYTDKIINYYKNSAATTFTEVDGFENPFDGIFVVNNAAPVLMDIDGDEELDALIGNKYSESYYDYNSYTYVYTYSKIDYYKKNEGQFKQEEDNPLRNHELDGLFAPSFGDLDGDGDLDMISGGYEGQVVYYRNDDGVYVREDEFSPFANIDLGWLAAADLVDIDNDNDLDLFVTNGYREMRFFRNEGTSKLPSFVEDHEDNPLIYAVEFPVWYTPFLSFTDLDHDGDFDLLFNGVSSYQRSSQILYFENQGSKELPEYDDDAVEGLFPSLLDRSPKMDFVDFDGDGDLDCFIGLYNGTISYFKNENPPVETMVSTTVVQYDPKVDDPIVVDPSLTLSDPDGDLVVQATVSILEYDPGEVLGFTAQKNITGAFDAETGVLRFNGKANMKDYETLLRTVTFKINVNDANRKKASKAFVDKNISFAVFDVDFTTPATSLKAISVPGSSEIIVYNAVAPNSNFDNKFLRIEGLSGGNKVSIFNRWGDKVYEVDDYGNIITGNVFRGFSESGSALPSGTYFYSIEIPGSKLVTGYLTLKH